MQPPKIIAIADLIVPEERQRKQFPTESELELAQSIDRMGLIHAILLRPDGQTLVAGERRLRAIRTHLTPLGKGLTYDGHFIPAGWVPYAIAASDDPIDLEEIELEENFRRKDLTWQEHAAATARLHELRAGQKARATASEGPAGLPGGNILPPTLQTIADTARELVQREAGREPNANDFDTTRKEVLIARHLDKPEVAKAPTLKDAFKALKKIEEADRNRALAVMVGETFSAADHAVHNANCLEWMANHIAGVGMSPENLPAQYDVILTDPPYGMGAHEFGDAAGRLTQIDHQYDDSYESWQTLMRAWCPLSYAITKPQAHAYVFCDIDRFHELKAMMQEAGWYVFRTPFTNYKQNSGRVPLPDRGPRRQSEWLLYAIKGDKPVNFIGSDVIVTGSDENLTHGAQKPVALYSELLRRSVRPGDRVLDTFGGTGTLLPAAHELKCRATVIEQNPTYYGICIERLQALGAQKELV